MKNEVINNLLEALQYSPDNVPLRLQVAQMMLKEKLFAEGAEQFQIVLEKDYGNTKAQLGLAECYYHQQKFSAAIIVYEQITSYLNLPDRVLYIKSLLKENAIQQAMDIYQQILAQYPDFSDEEIDGHLRMTAGSAGGDDF